MDGEGRKEWPPHLARFLSLRETEPALHAGAACIFAGPIDTAALREVVALGAERYARFRQMPRGRLFPSYEEIDQIDVEPHVRTTRAAPPGGDAQLASAASEIWSRRLDARRPLWDVTLVEGLAENRSAVVLRLHRSLTDDGGALVAVRELLGPHGAADKPAKRALARRARQGTALESLVGDLGTGAERAAALGRELTNLLEPREALAQARGFARQLEAASTLVASPAPETPFNGVAGPARRVGWVRLSRDALAGIETALDATRGEVLLTIVADALGRYLRARGRTTVALELMAIVRRGGTGAPGDEASGALAPLPVDDQPPAERCAAIRAALDDEHYRVRLADFDGLTSLCLTLPAPLRGIAVTLCHQAANLLCVEIAGAAPRVEVQHRAVRHVLPIAPLPWNLGLSIACAASSSDEVAIGLNAAADLVPDLASFENALRSAYVEMAAASGVPAIDPRRLTA